MADTDLPEGVYARDGERFVPTELARGPWDPGAQHGGPPAALLGRAVERHEPAEATFVARVTVELLRPVPMAPFGVSARTLRPGRRVQLVEAALVHDGTEIVRATALRIRETDLPLPPGARPEIEPPVGGGAPLVFDEPEERPRSFGDAMEIRPVRGGPHVLGPALAWFRLRVPIVAGEETSPLMRVLAAADFGNGISAPFPWGEDWVFINPDLTVSLHRRADGEWIALDATTFPEPNGVGLAESALFDRSGHIGRSVQSLYLDRR